MAHVSNHARIGTVLGERGVGDLRQRPQGVGKQQPVETVIGFCRQLQQLLARVPAAHDGGVHVEEVTWQGTAEQGADLVGHGVVGMQNGADGELYGIVSAPVDRQLDLLFGTAFWAVQGQ